MRPPLPPFSPASLPVRALVLPALLAVPIALGLSACAGHARSEPSPSSPHASASAAAASLGDHYAALGRVADSLVAALSSDDAAPSELAQVTAQNLAGRIDALADDYLTVSAAMTAADYERGLSLWMRLAIAQAALELLQDDARRLAADPTTGASDVHDLADRLSGALELGRASGRAASRLFDATVTADTPPRDSTAASLPSSACATCRPSLSSRS